MAALGFNKLEQNIQDSLDHSVQLLQDALAADAQYLDLSERLQLVRSEEPTVSGLHDYDYPDQNTTAQGSLRHTVREVSDMRKVPLPPELSEQFGHMECNCMMGLFAEVSRAWLAIDSNIFVWNFEDGSDLAYFDGLNETIQSVCLVKTKPGIFQSHISYLLCLTTPVDIVLLGVSFTKPFDSSVSIIGQSAGEMHLLPEPLFSVPTDNTAIVSVTGTQTGRIFMAAKDGCLYELYYQAQDGWFGRKCRKINHSSSKITAVLPSFLNFSFVEDDSLAQLSVDDTRGILYTRSEKGMIQVYDLGEDGCGMRRVAAMSQSSIQYRASLVAKTIDSKHFNNICHISPISRTESANIQLMAVTESGVRLYFSLCRFGTLNGRPSQISLVHVRLPPRVTEGIQTVKPDNAKQVYSKQGTLLLLCSESDDADLLWVVSPDSYPFTKVLMETFDTIRLDGHTWSVSEFSDPVRSELTNPQAIEPPLVVRQHAQPPRKFVIINSQATYLFTKQSPVDQLRELLIRSNGPDSPEISSYFRTHQADQACASCLILACTQQNQTQLQISLWASQAFFLHGGEPDMFPSQDTYPVAGHLPFSPIANQNMGHQQQDYSRFIPGLNQPGMHPSQMSTPYPVGRPPYGDPNNSVIGGKMNYSGKHNGLCLYFARILRPIWDARIFQVFRNKTGKTHTAHLSCVVTNEELSAYLVQLTALKTFMSKNAHMSSQINSDLIQNRGMSFDRDPTRNSTQEVCIQEKISLQCVYDLLCIVCEVLGLLQILSYHQFHLIAAALTQDQQKSLQNSSLKLLVTDGRQLTDALIQCLIKQYLNDNAATDAISTRLLDVCPTFYSPQDAQCSKANEILEATKNCQSQEESTQQLHIALKMYKEIALQLDLSSVCCSFSSVHFYVGIVDLALARAGRLDEQQIALMYYKNGEIPDDVNGRHAYMNRMDCYKYITDTLTYLMSCCKGEVNCLTEQQAQTHLDRVFDVALQSDDELFHVSLYDWLIQNNLTEKLLEIQSTYLEDYLKRRSADHGTKEMFSILDLLWNYYEKTGNHSAAAQVLARLAHTQSDGLGLQKRIEYLSRAAINAKSCSQNASDGQLLDELEEKLEVCRLQIQVHEAMVALNQPELKPLCEKINSQLMDITTLYGDYADIYDLSECKLAILHSATHYDPSLVENLWTDIIAKTLKETTGVSKETRMTMLSTKLMKLGKMYLSSERYFPIAFLIKILEQSSCQHSFNVGFVYTTLMKVDVNIAKLLEIYDRLFKSKDSFWHSRHQPFYLLYVILDMLDTFVKSSAQIPLPYRRQLTTRCLDNVSNYLVELQATTSTRDSAVQQLISQYKNLQARLEQI